MRKLIGNIQLMMECCVLYYEEDRNQNEIADLLKISRPTVSKLLQEAKKMGMVKITLEDPMEKEYRDLEEMLVRKLNLEKVILVGDRIGEEEQRKEVAKNAARHLSEILNDGDIVGVSMGRSVKGMIPYVDRGASKKIDFVPLLGGAPWDDSQNDANTVLTQLAQAYQAKANPLVAPAYIKDKKMREEFLNTPEALRTIPLIRKANVALVGIGIPLEEGSTLRSTGFFTPKHFDEMREKRAVGNICLQCYDIQGKENSFLCNKNVFGLKLSSIKKIPQVIGTAHRADQAAAVIGAARGGFIKTLVLNYSSAIAISDMLNTALDKNSKRIKEK
ncbi:MAG: sugar-binding domain-containing protein [Peptostreptococcaceae bacterium]|nr:sugar-binding domain-containing protein [Peptostreptococcaceae bacterium]